MKKHLFGLAFCLLSAGASAVTITFDAMPNGGVSDFSYDADNDGTPDAVFTKLNGGTMSPIGPGPNQNYTSDPGLMGGTPVSSGSAAAPTGFDMRVDFGNGAKTSLGFGFARSVSCAGKAVGYAEQTEVVTIKVFDTNNNLLGSATSAAPTCTATSAGVSSYVEGQVAVTFSGTAAYALIDFDGSTAYILDNFNGTFGSQEIAASATPASIPTLGEWGMIFMASLMAMFGIRRMRCSK